VATPFYVSTEQWYTEKAEYARKGIARGKPIVALEFAHGIALCAENYSATLRKISEIYDRIAFAGVGKFDEYENLRKAGVRYADMRGYSFCRQDVAARNLANEFSAVLGSIFTREAKALEVEVLVAEIGEKDGDPNAFYQITFDGIITDHRNYAAIGPEADTLRDVLRADWKPGLPLDATVKLGLRAMTRAGNAARELNERNLEIAVLDHRRDGRKFKRLAPEEVRGLVSG
jgi:proteasome alpha subunit